MSKTIAAFVSDMAGLTVSGVTTSRAYRPEGIPAAHLPQLWLEFPKSERDTDYSISCIDTGKIRTVQIVVCIEADGQSKPATKYAATIAMQDALETALDSYAEDATLKISYNTDSGGLQVGDVVYYIATADVTAFVL